ncbi:MAG: hypothetical protein ACKV2U_19530 [Bryobacteraceae bacterium]
MSAEDLAGLGRWKSGVYVVSLRGGARFYPVPVPTVEMYHLLRRAVGAVAFTPGPAPGGLENSVGPFAFDGERLWFANRFYDGEGTSGVGAVGSFDPATRRYEMRYLPEIAPWAASVLALDGRFVWIGLMRQPEGSAYGAGVLRFDKETELVRKYPIDGYVSTIVRAGSALYFGTAYGVYTLDADERRLTHVRVEPGPEGPRRIVTESIPIQ